MSQTTVGSHLEQPLDVLSQLGLQHVGGHLQVLALLVVAEPVEEPLGNSVSFGVVDETGDGVALLLVELSGADTGVDPEDLANEEAEPAAHSLDLLECEGDGPLAIDVGVEDTMDVLEAGVSILDDK